MAQRPRAAADTLNVNLRDELFKKLDEMLRAAEIAIDEDDLDDLTDDADLQGLFAAYLCPLGDIKIEGEITLDQIEGWGIPKISTETIRRIWEEATKNKDQLVDARAALHALFAERDLWSDYLDDYAETTEKTLRALFVALVFLLLAAVFSLHYAVFYRPLLVLGVLTAGAAGSCASLMSRMPSLEASLSGKLDAYVRGVLSRIGTGLITTVVGCASLAWIPVSIQAHSFGDIVKTCTAIPSASPSTTCTSLGTLILLGVPVLIGFFSEGALPLFGQRILGKAAVSPATPRSRRRGRL